MNFHTQLFEFITAFTLKRAFKLVALLAIILAAGWIVESYSGYLRLYRLERVMGLVERVRKLDSEGNESVKETRDLLILELNRLVDVSQGSLDAREDYTPRVKQLLLRFVFGGLPWFALSVFTVLDLMRRKKSAVAVFFALQSFTILFGFVALAIPGLSNRWLDYLVVPWGLFLIVLIIPGSIAALETVRRVRASAQKKTIVNNLRQIYAAASQYTLEHGEPPKSLADIVGVDGYIRKIEPVAGESYEGLKLGPDDTLSVTTKDGEVVTYEP